MGLISAKASYKKCVETAALQLSLSTSLYPLYLSLPPPLATSLSLSLPLSTSLSLSLSLPLSTSLYLSLPLSLSLSLSLSTSLSLSLYLSLPLSTSLYLHLSLPLFRCCNTRHTTPLLFQNKQEAGCNPCPTRGQQRPQGQWRLRSLTTSSSSLLSTTIATHRGSKLLHSIHHRQESHHLTVSTPVSVYTAVP